MSKAKIDEIADRLEDLVAKLERRSSDREETYRRTLKKAAAVLEETKSSFKSARLKKLREKIETVLSE